MLQVWRTIRGYSILGLRALYFALAGVMQRFEYLKFGLSMVLVFVGAKMLASDLYHMPALLSLAVVMVILATSIVVSLLKSRAEAQVAHGAVVPGTEPTARGAEVES